MQCTVVCVPKGGFESQAIPIIESGARWVCELDEGGDVHEPLHRDVLVKEWTEFFESRPDDDGSPVTILVFEDEGDYGKAEDEFSATDTSVT